MDTEAVVHMYSGILAIKRNAFESVLMRINTEPIIQSQKEENKYHILMHVYGI